MPSLRAAEALGELGDPAAARGLKLFEDRRDTIQLTIVERDGDDLVFSFTANSDNGVEFGEYQIYFE